MTDWSGESRAFSQTSLLESPCILANEGEYMLRHAAHRLPVGISPVPSMTQGVKCCRSLWCLQKRSMELHRDRSAREKSGPAFFRKVHEGTIQIEPKVIQIEPNVVTCSLRLFLWWCDAVLEAWAATLKSTVLGMHLAAMIRKYRIYGLCYIWGD